MYDKTFKMGLASQKTRAWRQREVGTSCSQGVREHLLWKATLSKDISGSPCRKSAYIVAVDLMWCATVSRVTGGSRGWSLSSQNSKKALVISLVI